MARFLLVLCPSVAMGAQQLIDAAEAILPGLCAEVDHRTPAHLGALVRGAEEEHLRLQLFADVQASAGGLLLELVLLSCEPMGLGAPQTRRVFERALDLIVAEQPGFEVGFRSDRDGALPGSGRSRAHA